jgi:hypothetical protein
MASFTDVIPQFNPYIQQLPVEAMAKVGMEKQERYDQGLQKIQSQIDQVAGLSLYRDSDKQQLQSKLNELGTKLKTVAAGDFSNYQLVNSVAGMAGTIMKDPIVLAGVQSTQNIKNNEKLMEEARQKGELTPDNLDYYSKKLSAYENSGLVDDRGKPIVFGAKYEPHFDVEKFARETFNAVKPSNMSWDEVFTKDVNGKTVYSPVMLQMEKEGLFPETVRQTIDQIFSDPRVAKQLQITGEYNYKGQDANSLKTMLVGQQNFKIAEINNEIQDLTLKKNSTENLEEKGKIDIQIKNLQDQLPKIQNSYSSLLQAADSNTEAVRGYLYENDVRDRYTSMFGYMKTKQNRVQDPMWKANFDMENEAQRRREWSADFSYKERRDQIEDKQWEIEQAAAQKAADAERGRKALGDNFNRDNFDKTYDAVTTQYANYDIASQSYTNSGNELIYRSYYSADPQQRVRLQDLINRGSTREEAITAMVDQDAKASGVDINTFRTNKINESVATLTRKGSGNIAKELSDALAVYTQSKQTFNNAKIIKDELDKVDNGVLSQTLGKLYEGNEIKPLTLKFRGQNVDLSKQDIIDIGVYQRGYKHIYGFAIDDSARQAAKAAEARLGQKGLQGVLDFVMRTKGSQYAGGLDLGTKLARTLGSPFEVVTDIYSKVMGDTGDFTGLFNEVDKVYNAIDTSDYSEGLEKKSEVAKRFVTPANMSTSIFTDKEATNKLILSDVKVIAANYSDVGNYSPDYKAFTEYVSGIEDPKDLTIKAGIKYLPGGEQLVELVAYDGGKRKGGLTLQPDEADDFVDTSNLYVSQDQLMAENAMIARGLNSTSYGDADDVETYMNRDAEFQKIRGDFPQLQGLSGYDVMGNIVNLNGRYYGKVFVQDLISGKPYMFTTDGYDFPTVYNTMRAITPNEIGRIVNTPTK